MQRLRRLIWPLTVVLLPLALMAWTSLQGWRASSVLDEAQVMQQWLANPSDALVEQLPYQERVQASSVGRRDRFEWQVEQAKADRGWLRLRQALAGLGFWLALAALLAGPAGWLKLRLDAWRALKSQTFLYQHLSRSWHALGRWLVAYTCLLVAALTMVLLYELSWGWSHLKAGGWTLLLALPLAGVIYLGLLLIERLRAQWHAMQAPSSAFLGRALGRNEAPQLWAWIEQLARALNAPPPDHIVVGVDQSFFVTSVPVVLHPSQHELSGRTLYLPLTYLSTLSQAETAAIIGHELGHFSNRDTERSSEISARFSLMCTHFALISGADAEPAWIERPAIWMAAHFLHHFQVAVHHWGRQQELLADRSGAAVAGERLFCQALLRVVALDREIDQVLHERPAGNLIQALSQRLQSSVLQLGGEQLEHAISHPFDTHPSTALRMQQLGVVLDAPLLAAATRRPSNDDRQWFAQLTQAAPTTAATTSKETFI